MTLEMLRKMAADDLLVIVLLAVWSLAALTVILQRVYVLWKVIPRSEAFKERVMASVQRGELQAASALCEASSVPLAEVFERGLAVHARTPDLTAGAVALKRAEVVQEFKRYLWLLGTVGSSAPFIGLFGTVVGIIRAFHSMSQAGAGGFKVVASGISEALIATAGGLLIAIYAVVAYNYFVNRVNQLGLAYKVYSEEFLAGLAGASPSRRSAERDGAPAAGTARAAAPAEV